MAAMEATAARPEEKGTAGLGGKEKTAAAAFKFNAHAPEFVPVSHRHAEAQVAPAPPAIPPGCCYYYNPWFHFVGDAGVGGLAGADWFYFAEQELGQHLVPDSPRGGTRYPGNAPDALQRIVKQVEYQFSDSNLVSSDYMMKLINKDPEGYVPIAAIVSQKKVKSLGSSNFILAKALQSSSKLAVSEDGMRVKRKQVFTERDREELQARTVVVENLPEESSRRNLEKIFSTVGRVKNVRICYPQDPNTARHSKSDVLISNKMHALVEFESADQADKAAEKLNDERNWRKGLRVRVMLRRSPKSVIRGKRGDYDFFDGISDDDEQSSIRQLETSRSLKLPYEQHVEESPSGVRRTWSLGRGKSRGGLQSHNGRGVLSPAPQPSSITRTESSSKQSPRKQGMADGTRGILSPSPQPGTIVQSEATRQPLRGPRMPDGTRGFTMGRGKSLHQVLSCPSLEQ